MEVGVYFGGMWISKGLFSRDEFRRKNYRGYLGAGMIIVFNELRFFFWVYLFS